MTSRERIRTAALALTLAVPPILLGEAGDHFFGLLGAVLGLLLLDVLLRRFFPAGTAALTVVLLLYATALLPATEAWSGTGVAGFLVTTAALALWWKCSDRVSAAASVGAGVLFGLAGALLVGGAPSGGFHLAEDLFGSRHGLLYWTPLLWGGLLGYVPLLRRAPRVSSAPLLALLAFTLASVTASRPAAPPDLRFVPALPLFGLGLAAFLEGLRSAIARHPQRVLAGVGGALVLWNFLFMHQYRAEWIRRDDTVSFPQVAENNAALFASTFGAPVAWPANWAFALGNDVSPDRFDVLVGRRVFDEPGAAVDLGDRRSEPLLAEGWSVRHPCGDVACREVEERARLFAVLDRPETLDLVVRAQGAGRLTLRVNGSGIPPLRLAPVLGDQAVRLESARLRRGLNAFDFEVEPGGQALIHRLTFLRVPRS